MTKLTHDQLRSESGRQRRHAVTTWLTAQGWDLPRWVHWCRNPRTGTEFWNDWYELDAYELELEPPTHWLPMPPYPTSKANTLGTPTRWRLRRRA